MALGATSFATAAESGSESFDGACQMSGVVRRDPPLSGVPAPTEVRGSFTGTRSGRFTDGTLSPGEDLMALYELCNGSGLRLIRGDARIVSAGLSG